MCLLDCIDRNDTSCSTCLDLSYLPESQHSGVAYTACSVPVKELRSCLIHDLCRSAQKAVVP